MPDGENRTVKWTARVHVEWLRGLADFRAEIGDLTREARTTRPRALAYREVSDERCTDVGGRKRFREDHLARIHKLEALLPPSARGTPTYPGVARLLVWRGVDVELIVPPGPSLPAARAERLRRECLRRLAWLRAPASARQRLPNDGRVAMQRALETIDPGCPTLVAALGRLPDAPPAAVGQPLNFSATRADPFGNLDGGRLVAHASQAGYPWLVVATVAHGVPHIGLGTAGEALRFRPEPGDRGRTNGRGPLIDLDG